jgi:hypothetical protein
MRATKPFYLTTHASLHFHESINRLYTVSDASARGRGRINYSLYVLYIVYGEHFFTPSHSRLHSV